MAYCACLIQEHSMNDLFGSRGQKAEAAYTAKDIAVLEGLEPVRRRPGMYIGGTDASALNYLVLNGAGRTVYAQDDAALEGARRTSSRC